MSTVTNCYLCLLLLVVALVSLRAAVLRLWVFDKHQTAQAAMRDRVRHDVARSRSRSSSRSSDHGHCVRITAIRAVRCGRDHVGHFGQSGGAGVRVGGLTQRLDNHRALREGKKERGIKRERERMKERETQRERKRVRV